VKKIILTGGGTAGHVIPNLALVPELKAAGYEIYYIGSHTGIERELVERANIPYFGISSGKMRRYMSVKNMTDLLRVCKGFVDAARVIRKIRPDIIFSKGGFVVVPVVAAARFLRVKAVIHESDMTPGLANRLAIPFAAKVCVSFPETLKHVPEKKGVLTGSPIRPELLAGSKIRMSLGFDNRPVLLITGGSQGAAAINTCVREALPQLLENFNVVHLCGKGNLAKIEQPGPVVRDTNRSPVQPGYVQFEYLNEEMADMLALADIVISRAGANTLFELAALRKPNLLIPLPAEVSRGDQLLNAASFERQGFSMVLPEGDMTPRRLAADVKQLFKKREEFTRNMEAARDVTGGTRRVMDVIAHVTQL